MNLSFSYATIGKMDAGNSFEFSSSARTVLFTQPHNLTDSAPYSNRFDILNRANDFKVHSILITIKSHGLVMKLSRETESFQNARFLNGKELSPTALGHSGPFKIPFDRSFMTR